MQPHGPWTILKRHPIYQSGWLEVSRDDVLRPDGQPGSHDLVRLRRGVTVIALDDAGLVHLTEEFHYAVGRVTLEGVSGGRDDNEPPLACARRELREELGIEAAAWIDLGILDPITSVVESATQLFLARRLTFHDRQPEPTEQIRHVTLPLQEAVDLVMTGGITQAATCVAILKTERLLQASR